MECFCFGAVTEWTSVLVDDGRYVLRLPSASITARTVCGYNENWATYSLTDLLADFARRHDPVPDCPTS
jgi:hypothetical protein